MKKLIVVLVLVLLGCAPALAHDEDAPVISAGYWDFDQEETGCSPILFCITDQPKDGFLGDTGATSPARLVSSTDRQQGDHAGRWQ